MMHRWVMATAAALLSAGCNSASSGGPAISGLTVVASPSCVLTATLQLATSRPATVRARVVNRGAAANTFETPAEPSPMTTHAIPLLGMRAQSDFAITVTATDEDGRVTTATASFHTPALPASLPPVTVVTNDATETAPGYLVLDVWEYSGAPVASPTTPLSAVLALDEDLQVVWYSQGYLVDPEKLPNGDFVALTSTSLADPPVATGWEEVDMLGRTVRSTSAGSLGLVGLGAAISPEPSGSLLSTSMVLEPVTGYPDGGGDATLAVVGSDLLELGADGGASVIVDTFNVFNPFVEGSASLFDDGTFTNPFFPDAGATRDWMHTDAITADPLDETLLVSSRTQSWIYDLRRDGTLAWTLGPGGDFSLKNAGDTLQYGQHAAYVTPGGTVMCFDNGVGRPLPAGAAPFSRALELSLDTTSMTATIAWQYRGDGFYSSLYGSAVLLPGGAAGAGTVLVDDGCELTDPSGSVTDPTNRKSARVMEVTHATPPALVAEVDVGAPPGGFAADPSSSGFVVYRASKWASLY